MLGRDPSDICQVIIASGENDMVLLPSGLVPRFGAVQQHFDAVGVRASSGAPNSVPPTIPLFPAQSSCPSVFVFPSIL